MSSHDLTPLTARQGASFVGVSQMNSIGLCDPLQSEIGETDETTQHRWFRFPVCEHTDGMMAYFDVCTPGDDDTFWLSEAETYRLVCHALLQQLPERAFAEAATSLVEMYEFYRHVLPTSRLETNEPVNAALSGSYTAPIYPITEE